MTCETQSEKTMTAEEVAEAENVVDEGITPCSITMETIINARTALSRLAAQAARVPGLEGLIAAGKRHIERMWLDLQESGCPRPLPLENGTSFDPCDGIRWLRSRAEQAESERDAARRENDHLLKRHAAERRQLMKEAADATKQAEENMAERNAEVAEAESLRERVATLEKETATLTETLTHRGRAVDAANRRADTAEARVRELTEENERLSKHHADRCEERNAAQARVREMEGRLMDAGLCPRGDHKLEDHDERGRHPFCGAGTPSQTPPAPAQGLPPHPKQVHAMMHPMGDDWDSLDRPYADGYYLGVLDERARASASPTPSPAQGLKCRQCKGSGTDVDTDEEGGTQNETHSPCSWCKGSGREPSPAQAHGHNNVWQDLLSAVWCLRRPVGHDGDEESGQHDADCERCAYDALQAKAEAARAALAPTPPPGLREAVGFLVEQVRLNEEVHRLPDQGLMAVKMTAAQGRAVLAAYDATGGGGWGAKMQDDLREVARLAAYGTPGETHTPLGGSAYHAVQALREDAAKYRAAVERLEHERKAGAEKSHWDYAHVILTGDVPADSPPPAPSETLDKARVVEVVRYLAQQRMDRPTLYQTGWVDALSEFTNRLGLTLDTPPSGPGGGEDWPLPPHEHCEMKCLVGRPQECAGPEMAGIRDATSARIAPTPTPSVLDALTSLGRALRANSGGIHTMVTLEVSGDHYDTVSCGLLTHEYTRVYADRIHCETGEVPVRIVRRTTTPNPSTASNSSPTPEVQPLKPETDACGACNGPLESSRTAVCETCAPEREWFEQAAAVETVMAPALPTAPDVEWCDTSEGAWRTTQSNAARDLARGLADAKREVAEARKATEDAMRESTHRYEVEIPEAMKKAAESMRERAAAESMRERAAKECDRTANNPDVPDTIREAARLLAKCIRALPLE